MSSKIVKNYVSKGLKKWATLPGMNLVKIHKQTGFSISQLTDWKNKGERAVGPKNMLKLAVDAPRSIWWDFLAAAGLPKEVVLEKLEQEGLLRGSQVTRSVVEAAVAHAETIHRRRGDAKGRGQGRKRKKG